MISYQENSLILHIYQNQINNALIFSSFLLSRDLALNHTWNPQGAVGAFANLTAVSPSKNMLFSFWKAFPSWPLNVALLFTNFTLNFVRCFLWNDNECSQGVHLDSWILLAKLNYALGNYTDSLKYYEKAQVKYIEDISKRQLEATCLEPLFICRSRASRKSNCLRGLSRSWLRLLPSKAFATKNFLCRCNSLFKSFNELCNLLI